MCIRDSQQAGTFGYEEVAYLLRLGRLPAAEELAQFNQILANARQMPAAFTEDMILKAPVSYTHLCDRGGWWVPKKPGKPDSHA